MAFLFRWLMRALVAMGILALLGCAFAWYVASRSLPDYDRSFVLDGPRGAVEIVRDSHAVPHILVEQDLDAFFGLGFAHAQDRLWQMTLMRRTVQGRLSELFGRETLDIDRLMRALDLYGLSQAAVGVQDEPTLEALRAYSDGVNAWLRVVQAEALGRGAPEFFLFDAFQTSIAPWTPADSIAVQKLMALQLTDKAARETLHARLLLALPPERARDLASESPNAPVMSLPDYGALPEPPSGDRAAAPRDADRSRVRRGVGATVAGAEGPAPEGGGPDPDPAPHPLDPVGRPGNVGASNAFAASGARAAGGAPLLATDPHLALSAPAIWMLARMDLAEGSVMGGTIPGIPAVLIGRNPNFGWGLTASYLDDQDIVIERVNPEDPAQYLTPSGWRPFIERTAVIGIRGGGEETMTLRWTRHGPVLPGDAFGVTAVTPEGHVAALAWTALEVEDRSVGAAIRLMRAQTVREGRIAARQYLAPSVMITMADRRSIAMQMAGAAPTRQAGHTSQGIIPAPGWLAENDWTGRRAFEANPWVIDPPGGIVANTNNRLTDAAFPDHLSFDWGDSHRILRATRLLNGRAVHTLPSFIEIQTDVVSEAARLLLPLIARDLWYSGEPAAEGTAERRRQLALERLATWNGAMSEHTPEPLIYAAWVRALQRRLIVDELGSLAGELPQPDPVFLERVFRDVDGAAAWCDVTQTSVQEPCADMARLALDEALIELEERFGARLESWRWGDAHEALHRHQTLGFAPLVRLLVNIRQSTPGGDETLMRGQMPGNGAEPYLNLHASGLRAVYDFSDPDSSVFVIATGESGHPLSRHYDDLAALWRRSEYVPMSFDEVLARAGAVGVTRITPRAAAAGAAAEAAE